MMWGIFNGLCGLIFITISLCSFASIVLYHGEYTQHQLYNHAGLSIVFTFAWVWAFKQAFEAWYIYKSR